MKTILIIYFLSVQSSYIANSEAVATQDVFDTVQFYMSDGKSWRVRTFAADQDVHSWSLGSDVTDLPALARANTEKHYGDVVRHTYIVETDGGLDGVRRELVSAQANFYRFVEHLRLTLLVSSLTKSSKYFSIPAVSLTRGQAI